MSFAHPLWLFALLALPAVALWMAWAASIRRKRLDRYASREFWPTVAGTISWPKKRFKTVLRLCALGFLIVAAARPQWGIKERPLVREGSDIFICLDVSTSMYSRDIAPTRLDSAKQQIRSLIYNLKGDRVGLVLFAGDAFVQCPLTLDYGLAVSLLESASPDSVAVQGTRLGVAIETAVKAFDRSAFGTKSIILVTDGEDQGSNPLGAAEAAAKDGIVIECVGIGTTEGVPILLPNGEYKEDRQGRKVTSRLDADALTKIALATGGKAVVTNTSGNMDLDTLYNEIKNYEKKRIESNEVNILEDRFQWPLGVAILLLALELFLGDRVRENGGARRRFSIQRRSARPTAATRPAPAVRSGAATNITSIVPLLAVLLMGSFAVAPGNARAGGWEFGNQAARLCFEGNEALKNGKIEEALSKYRDAQVIAPDTPVLDYNIGVALARQKKLDEARAAFDVAARKAHDNPGLRAKALYNAGVSDFESAKGLAADPRQLDQAIQRIGQSIDANQKALDAQPQFDDAHQNLSESRQLLQQLIEQKKMAQQQPQKGEEGNDPNGTNKDDQKDQQGKGQEGKNDKQEQDKNQKQSQEQQNKEGEKQEGQEQQGEGMTPTPTVTPEPRQGKEEEGKEEQDKEKQAQEAGEGEEKEGQQASEGGEQQQGEQVPVGEMTKEDALRLLSTLPNEQPEALQKALQAGQGSIRLEKDW